MANRTITFTIEGRDNLTAALKSANAALKNLGQVKKINAPTPDLSKLSQALQQYKSLQAALKNQAQSLTQLNQNTAAFNKSQAKALQTASKLQELQAKQVQSRAQLAKARADLLEMRGSGADKSAIAAQKSAIAQLNAAYRDLNVQIRNAKAENKSAQSDFKNISAQHSSAQAAIQQYQRQAQALRQLQSSMQAAGLNVSNIVAAENQLAAAVAHANSELQHQQRLANFNQAQQNLSNAYSNFQNSMQTAQSVMNPFVGASQNAMTYEKALDRLQALTQLKNIRAGNLAAVEEEMSGLNAEINRLGESTEFTRGEVVNAANRYAMSGWNAKQIQAVLSSTVDMASVSMSHNVERMADIFSDDLTILGVKAGDTIKLANGKTVDAVRHVMDAYTYAITNANLDEEFLHTSLTYNAPAMKLAGMSTEDIFAMNMIAANAGLKGSISGTGFRNVALRLVASPKKAAEELEKLGFGATEIQKEMAAAGQAFKDLGVSVGSTPWDKILAIKTEYDKNAALGQVGADRNAAMLNNLFGKTGFSTAETLFRGSNLEQIQEMARIMSGAESENWLADTAKIMRDNTRTSIDYVTSALDALQGAAGDALNPTIKSVADTLSPMILSMAQFTREHPKIVQALAVIATAASAAIVAISGCGLALAGFNFAASIFPILSAGIMTAARAAMAFCMTPLGAALTAIAALALLVAYNWDYLADSFNTFTNSISQSFGPVISNLMNSFSQLQAAFSNLFSGMDLSFIGTALGNIFVGFAGIALTAIATVATAIANLTKMLTDLSTDFLNVLNSIKNADLQGAFSGLGDTLLHFGENFKNIFAESAQVFKDGLQGADAALMTFNGIYPHSDYNHGGGGGDFGPLIDSSTQAGESLQGVAMPAQEVAGVLPSLPPELQNLATAAQPVPPELTNVGNSAQTSAPQIMQVGSSAQSAAPQLQAMASAAGQVASALSAKAAEIGSIKIPQPQLVNVPITVQTPVAHNAQGGIYNQGSFLTTFAENSPEAAIPIDNSARAKNLWLETGNLLGMTNSAETFNINFNANINAAGEVRNEISTWLDEAKSSFEDLFERFLSERQRRSFA